MATTVKELRDRLDELPDELLVVMSKDGEGNSFSPLSECTDERYVAETTWSGELTESEDGIPVLCLWPTN